MQFGIFITQQIPRPWDDGAELKLFQDTLEQIELADALGIDYAWIVEQHFLEEYSHSSAPEVLLAAASQRTSRIRLGHGVMLMPPGYNVPARAAERIASLDLVSNGRAELGIGDSKSRMELEGFGIDPDHRRAMTLEAVEQVANMLVMEPYPGYVGRYFSMPARNVTPKPVQKPHPPLWIACSDDATIHAAAQMGIGALAHTFVDPDEAQRVVGDYYETLRCECTPIGHAVNANVAMVIPFYCHQDADEAVRIGSEAHGFFTYAARHYYAFGRHRAGRTNVAENAATVARELGNTIPIRGSHLMGSPEQIAARIRSFRAVGVDQIAFTTQAGRMRHEDICASLELFARDVLPEFAAGAAERQQTKADELAPYIDEALARKVRMVALDDDDIPVVDAYGLSSPSPELADLDKMPPATRDLILELQRVKEIASRLS